MEKLFDYIKLLVIALGTGFTWLFGVWDMPLITLVIFMILDQLTGVIRGYVNKDLSSDVGLKGIARKCVILIVLIVAVALDRLLNTGSWMFRTMVAYFYIANEGISLLENCASLGAPIPEKLKNALIQLKEGKKKESVNENV
ncbi:phage holin family protein [Clostridium perfringens]|uniref:phage holin family protein n=1 Tax=Clostridium perfringens TaxID=1502 RepID=UPI0018E44515|nr:phage holin family protein [Clostridium perfringens]MBI6110946.1 phage holin family protein [Clostridium perfringens]MBI6112914.1 phage holin family protein [Clostridium perfringens]